MLRPDAFFTPRLLRWPAGCHSPAGPPFLQVPGSRVRVPPVVFSKACGPNGLRACSIFGAPICAHHGTQHTRVCTGCLIPRGHRDHPHARRLVERIDRGDRLASGGSTRRVWASIGRHQGDGLKRLFRALRLTGWLRTPAIDPSRCRQVRMAVLSAETIRLTCASSRETYTCCSPDALRIRTTN